MLLLVVVVESVYVRQLEREKERGIERVRVCVCERERERENRYLSLPPLNQPCLILLEVRGGHVDLEGEGGGIVELEGTN